MIIAQGVIFHNLMKKILSFFWDTKIFTILPIRIDFSQKIPRSRSKSPQITFTKSTESLQTSDGKPLTSLSKSLMSSMKNLVCIFYSVTQSQKACFIFASQSILEFWFRQFNDFGHLHGGKVVSLHLCFYRCEKLHDHPVY